jgi:hypothetical protein
MMISTICFGDQELNPERALSGYKKSMPPGIASHAPSHLHRVQRAPAWTPSR